MKFYKTISYPDNPELKEKWDRYSQTNHPAEKPKQKWVPVVLVSSKPARKRWSSRAGGTLYKRKGT